jgi:hypothetical protein
VAVDRELVERARNGDHDACEVLAAAIVDDLYGVARLILRDLGTINLAHRARAVDAVGLADCQPIAPSTGDRPRRRAVVVAGAASPPLMGPDERTVKPGHLRAHWPARLDQR